VAPAIVKDNGDGTYSIQLTPPAPSEYAVDVRVDDVPVHGSPFAIEAPSSEALHEYHRGIYGALKERGLKELS